MSPKNLITELMNEIKRCEELLEEYKAIGSAGVFGTLVIKQDIATARQAIEEGDVAGMVIALKSLKERQ